MMHPYALTLLREVAIDNMPRVRKGGSEGVVIETNSGVDFPIEYCKVHLGIQDGRVFQTLEKRDDLEWV